MKNLKEFKELIERYETIELPEIEAAFNIPHCDVRKYLTGFGYCGSCKLCIAVNDDCDECVYGEDTGCMDDERATDTYNMINDAETPEELLTAYRNRAKFMRELLEEKGVE